MRELNPQSKQNQNSSGYNKHKKMSAILSDCFPDHTTETSNSKVAKKAVKYLLTA